MVKDADFHKIVRDPSKDVLVAFTAAWCGHCKAMAPAYEKVASIFANDKDIVIAKVDTTHAESQYIHKDFDVQGFPTIKFFPKGSDAVIDYQLGRTVDEFVDFINQHTGTHRTADGGLDSTAGVSDQFDAAIASLQTDPEKAIELAKEVASAAFPYAAYYRKVIEKVAGNGEQYLKKEITRLGNIFKKGAMIRGNADQFQIRLNILADVEQKYSSVAGAPVKDEL